MILVVEGPDGAGKTTFARGFAGRYHHEGPPPTDLGPGNLLGYYLAKVEDAATSSRFGATIVFDRLALGELVYGPILRGTSRLSLGDYRDFLARTRRMGAVHVLCLPPLRACHDNWEARARMGKEHFSDPHDYERTWDAFSQFIGFSDAVYDYTVGGTSK